MAPSLGPRSPIATTVARPAAGPYSGTGRGPRWTSPVRAKRHGLSVEQQQRALFVSDRGTGFGALDVLEDGLRGSRSRAPALRWILDTLTPALPSRGRGDDPRAWGDRAALDDGDRVGGTPRRHAARPADRLPGCVLALRQRLRVVVHRGRQGRRRAEPSGVRDARIAALRALIALSPHQLRGSSDAPRLRRPAPALGRRRRGRRPRQPRGARPAVAPGTRRVRPRPAVGRAGGDAGPATTRPPAPAPPGAARSRTRSTGRAGTDPRPRASRGGRDTSALLRDLAAAGGARAALAREALYTAPGPMALGGGTRRRRPRPDDSVERAGWGWARAACPADLPSPTVQGEP